MKVQSTDIPGVIVLEPTVFGDERGYFFEVYNERDLSTAGIRERFVQMNQSYSKKGVLRGLHYQAPPHAQSKLIRCLRGALFDAVVDLRRGSPTYGTWYGLELSEDNKRQLYVPRGFAHGFQALVDCELLYLCGYAGYSRSSEGGLRYNDPALAIRWPSDSPPLVNERDASFPLFKELDSPFLFK